jgi:hypothetical protein
MAAGCQHRGDRQESRRRTLVGEARLVLLGHILGVVDVLVLLTRVIVREKIEEAHCGR